MKYIRSIAMWMALSVISFSGSIFAQGTAFTYQGQLANGGAPANGRFDLTFTLFNVNSNGVAIAGPVTNAATAVSNGLFTATIDFGPGVFTGGSNWLEIAVSTNGANSFTTLAPRQQLTPVPYAIFAPNAGTAALAGNVAAGIAISNATIINSTLSGNGSGLLNLNASNITSGTVSDSILAANVLTINTAIYVTNIYVSNGVYTVTVPAAATQMVAKLWGAGGGAAASGGGGGAFVQSIFNVAAGQSFTVVVGQGGGTNSVLGGFGSGDAQGGQGGFDAAGQGGQASSLFSNNGSNYIMQAAAGAGGGGANSNPDSGYGGAGGNPGQQGLPHNSVYGGAGGTNGIGGGGGGGFSSGSPGTNYAANATTTGVSALSLAGGNGGTAGYYPLGPGQGGNGGGGGGGYGGGGGGGASSSVIGGGGGGGSYGTIIIGGNGVFAGNPADPNYISPAGQGAYSGLSGVGITAPGHDGLVVLIFTVQAVNVAAVVDASGFGGNGGGLTNLNASQLTGGTIPASVLPPNLQTLNISNGANLTNLNASSLAGGTVPLAQLPSVVVTNGASGVNISGTLSGTFSGNGSGLTNLNASQISSGTISVAQLPAGVAMLSSNQTFSGANVFRLSSDSQQGLLVTDGSTNSNVSIQPLTGLGSGFQAINFNGYFNGEHQYNANKARWRIFADQRGGSDSFNIDEYFGGVPNVLFSLNTNGVISGNGGGLTNLSASQITGSGNLAGTFTGNGGGLTNIPLSGIGMPGTLNFAQTFLTSTLNVGSGPGPIAVADVNGDGKPDLIVANNNAGSISVLTNNGSGGFSTASTIVINGGQMYVTAGDINHDGKPDLVVADQNDGTTGFIRVFTNNGAGIFGSNAIYSTSGFHVPLCVTLVDVNGNGQPDFVAGCSTPSGYILVYTNNGSGQFGLQTSFNNGSYDAQIIATDVNGDGKMDFVAMDRNSGQFGAFTNNGSGGFNLAGYSSDGVSHADSMAIADINGDGKVDLVTFVGSEVIVLTGDGQGNFLVKTNMTIPLSTVYSVVLTDVNGDGKPDIVYANFSGNSVVVMTNDGAGNFTLASTNSVGPSPDFIVTSDFNGDGKPDFAVANSGGSTLTELTYFQDIASSTAVSFTNSGSVLAGTLNGNFNGTASGTFGGTFNGNGNGLANVNAASLGGNAITTNSSGIVLGSPLNANLNPIYLKGIGDNNHGVGYATSTTNFTSLTPPDGPMLWGWSGGALGSMNPSPRLGLVWTASGVGIGTTNPASRLHVVSTNGDAEISVQSGDPGSHRWTLQSSSTNNSAGLGSSFQIIDRTVSASRMTIYTNGNLAIPGSVTNSGSLTVSGSAKVGGNPVTVGTESLRILRGEIAGTGSIDFGSGFTVNKNGTGDFTINFSSSFNGTPAVTATCNGSLLFPELYIVGSSSAEIKFFNTSSVLTDPAGFDFIAIGP